MRKLYAVPLGQGKWISRVCWGSCGMGLMGGINLGERYGEAIPCETPSAECPAFDGEMATPWGTIEEPNGAESEIYLRKLRKPDAVS